MSRRLLMGANVGAGLDPDAQAYIAAVQIADGQALETSAQIAINAFVVGCKADGTWPALKACCIMAGARTLAGALVPLVGTAPTNFNFVSGDYNRKTGLAGNRSTKYLNSNRNNNADPQNNQHLSVYVSSPPSTSTGSIDALIGCLDGLGNSQIIQLSSALQYKSRDGGGNQPSSLPASLSGLVGVSRSSATEYTYRASAGVISGTYTSTSSTPESQSIHVFQRGGAIQNFPTNARLAFYSIGESLNLALLDARVTTLINAFAAAIP